MRPARPTIVILLTLALGAASLGAVPASGSAGRSSPAANRVPSKRDLFHPPAERSPLWVPGEVLVQFKPGVRRAASRSVHARRGSRVLSTIRGFPGRIEHVSLPAGVSVERAVASYARHPAVAIVEPNLIREYADHATTVPSGKWYEHQWGLENTGQMHRNADGGRSSGRAGADIDAQGAWPTEDGDGALDDDPTVVAVVDTGVDVDHPDLVANLWVNIDAGTDGGCPDDHNGRSFGTGDCGNVDDRHGHGTHVAGTIAGEGTSAKGVIGVCPHCRIMVLKLGSSLTSAKIVKAFDYAIEQEAHIVNGSFGGPTWSRIEYAAIKRLHKNDILAVFAAGNHALDNDLGLPGSNPSFPASYNLPNIISVAASNHRDHYGYETRCDERDARRFCAFSSFGRESVDVAAPGVDVVSTWRLDDPKRGNYLVLNGTSMATPHVAGIAGLVRAEYPALDPVRIKNRIMNGADRNLRSMRKVWSLLFPGGKAAGKFTRTSGRASAEGALDPATDPDRNATKVTDGNVDGAERLRRQVRGRVNYPKDVNDVYRKRLRKGKRYRAVLRVPKGKDYDLWIWHPRIKQIWQFELGCITGRGRCPVIASGFQGNGKNEVLTFRARRTGVFFFHVAAWVKNRGRYVLTVKRA